MQLYREEAGYLERVWKCIETAGLDTVRAKIMDDYDGRRALSRVSKNRSAVRKDPWAERAAGREFHEFTPFAVLNPIMATVPAE